MIALSGTPVLTTARLTLRAPVAADWPHFCAFALSERSVFVRVPDIDEAKAWRAFGHVIGMWVLRGYGLFVFHETGHDTPLGMAGPWYPAAWPEREIGWSIWDEGAEGKGFAQEAARAALAHAFGPLGWTTAVSYVAPDNIRSAALARRLGAEEQAGAPHPGDAPCLVFRHSAPEVAR